MVTMVSQSRRSDRDAQFWRGEVERWRGEVERVGAENVGLRVRVGELEGQVSALAE